MPHTSRRLNIQVNLGEHGDDGEAKEEEEVLRLVLFVDEKLNSASFGAVLCSSFSFQLFLGLLSQTPRDLIEVLIASRVT